LVPVGTTLPERPSPDYRQGFRMWVYNKELFGGEGVRGWASTAKVVIRVVDALYDDYLAAPDRKKGMLPVVRLSGTKPVTTQTPAGRTTSYAPVLEIERWVPRPPVFDAIDATGDEK
jgi:hypothetical protein